jgi:hypothetical protein
LLKVYVLGEKKRAEMRAKWERERVVHANRCAIYFHSLNFVAAL